MDSKNTVEINVEPLLGKDNPLIVPDGTELVLTSMDTSLNHNLSDYTCSREGCCRYSAHLHKQVYHMTVEVRVDPIKLQMESLAKKYDCQALRGKWLWIGCLGSEILSDNKPREAEGFLKESLTGLSSVTKQDAHEPGTTKHLIQIGKTYEESNKDE